MTESMRQVAAVVDTLATLEGGGFPVRRPFPTARLSHFDPFLLLDHLGPVVWDPGEAIGAPDHPHRGFETVTYVLAGAHEHRDSHGNHGLLGPGDVQWMTAGAGVVHSEMPTEEFRSAGGCMEGFQIWVNLPAANKMMAPRYQDVAAASIPEASRDGVTVRVIAGVAMGQSAVIDTVTPILLWHATLSPGSTWIEPTPSDHRLMVYVFRGQGTFGPDDEVSREGQMVAFADGPGALRMSVSAELEEDMEVLVMGGVPIGEPIARHGPFVMNTMDEIHQAFEDYRQGTFGSIAPRTSG